MADSLKFVSKAITDFSNDISLILCSKSGNIFFSPFGLFSILTMAYQAAGGYTAKRLKNVLYITDVVTCAEEYRLLHSIFEKLPDVKFNNVCCVTIRDKLELKQEYCDKMRKVFETPVLAISFAKKNQPEKKINAYLDKHSTSKFHNIVKQSDCTEHTDMIFANGVYLKGDWMQRFDVYKNTRDDFFVTPTETIKCAMVKMHSVFKYADRDDINCQLVSIPLKNPTVSLLIILPKTRIGLKDLEGKLFRKNLADLHDNLSNASVVITMPKLKLENDVELEEPLREMGLGDMFTNEANFENMANEPGIKIDKVLQKVCFETGDQGNLVLRNDYQADVSTAAALVTLSSPSYSKFSFCANHPFIYMICFHDKCFLPLIVGRYAKP